MAGQPINSAKRRAFGMGVMPQKQRSAGLTLNAPVGGLNTVSPAGAMPASDCLTLTNMIPYQYGLRVRSGFQDHFTGLRWEDPYDPGIWKLLPVLTLLPFSGSSESGENDRLFACTRVGIFDVTDAYQVQSPFTTGYVDVSTAAYAFPIAIGKAGTGVGTAFTNTAGEHFLAYTDGANGYLLYRESTDDWIKITQGSGTDGLTISGADPGSFRFVMQWKNRLWFVPQDSTKTFYLEVRAYAGVAHALDFSPRFKYGGNLVGLWSWTLDGGQGVDDLLVGISRAGDVVVYQGTDPALPGAFGLRGVWWIGPVPPGRTVASDFGGDLFVLSRAGCLPLSKLVAGGLIRDPSVYETAKITNSFNKLMSERGSFDGWALTVHPNDNLLVINVPKLPGEDGPIQAVMSLANKGWAIHEGQPISCVATWHGLMYFGTADGRVCVSTGTMDSGIYTFYNTTGEFTEWQYADDGPQEINFAMLSAYQTLGSPNKKRVHMARPYFITDGDQPGYAIQARYDYDLNTVPIADVPDPVAATAGWGANWSAYPPIGSYVVGDMLWSSGVGQAGKQIGTAGMGTAVAVVLRGTSRSSTTLVSIDVLVDSGWYL